MLGKITQKDTIGAYAYINPKLKIFGWLNILTAILISSFYFVVGGWIIKYIYLGMIDFKAADYGVYFSNFTQNAIPTCLLTLVFLFLCMFL